MEINVKSLQMQGDDNTSLGLVEKLEKENQIFTVEFQIVWFIFESTTYLLSDSLFVDHFSSNIYELPLFAEGMFEVSKLFVELW